MLQENHRIHHHASDILTCSRFIVFESSLSRDVAQRVSKTFTNFQSPPVCAFIFRFQGRVNVR